MLISFFNKLISVINNRENDIKIHQLNRGTDSNTISVRSSGRMIKTARVIENCLSSSMFDNKFNFGLTNAKEGKEMKRREGERERERELSPLPAPIPEDVIVNSSHEIVGQYVPPVHPVHGRPSTKIHTYLHDTRQCESIAEWEALQAAPAWEHRAHLYARKVPSAAKTHRAISRYLRRDTLPNKSRSWRLIQISFR